MIFYLKYVLAVNLFFDYLILMLIIDYLQIKILIKNIKYVYNFRKGKKNVSTQLFESKEASIEAFHLVVQYLNILYPHVYEVKFINNKYSIKYKITSQTFNDDYPLP